MAVVYSENVVTYDNSSFPDLLQNIFTGQITFDQYLGFGLISLFAIMVIWWAFRKGSMKFSVWHALTAIVGGFLFGVALQSYTKIVDWLALGMKFTNIGATLLLIGVVWFIGVMCYNFIVTRGRTLVR